MDPLMELPEPAKTRIRAREAEAEEHFNRVLRACEGDEANARRRWSGDVNLHQDELRDAVEQARARIEEAKLLSAQHVFVAHANEYRNALRDHKELESVLASLREAVIKQYGEHARAAIQSREARQLEKASADWSAAQDVTAESGAPVLIGDAPFWRACRNYFRECNTGENSLLSADWDSLTDSWSFRGPAEAQAVFKSVATIAAKGFQTYDQDEPWRSWLAELRRRRCNYIESPTKAAYSQRAMEDPSKFGFVPPRVKGELRTGTVDENEMSELFGAEVAEQTKGSFVQTRFEGVHGRLERLFEASSNLCFEFESRAPNRSELPDVRAPHPDIHPASHEKSDVGTSSHLLLAAARKAVVMPILDSRGWTINKWGTLAGVGRSCPYDYLSGKRKLTDANRKALADELGLKREDLPN
jgi:hypothetical protein